MRAKKKLTSMIVLKTKLQSVLIRTDIEGYIGQDSSFITVTYHKEFFAAELSPEF
jgi:hypothetical protein